MLLNKLNANPQNIDLKNLFKETNLSMDHQIENLKKSELLQQNMGNNLIRQQQHIPQGPYMKHNYGISNSQNEMDMNNSNQARHNFYLDNIKNNKVINNNSSNVSSIMKALKDTGNFQLLQNIAAKVNSVKTGSNYNKGPSIQNEINSCQNSEQEMNFSLQTSKNHSIMQNNRMQQFIPKPSNTNYMNNQQQNPMIKNGLNLGNNQQNNSNSQQNIRDDDIMNSFNLSNNYD